MKDYPSIPGSNGTSFREIPDAYVFDKLDGSNLRFEWSRKRGWHKYGTRTRLLDEKDWQFGRAIPLFHRTLAEPLAKVIHDERWESCIVFCEHWGPNSFAGNHHKGQVPLDPDDQMYNTIIDVAPYKKGILGPNEFLKLFGDLPTAKFLGRFNFTRGFVERVWDDEIPNITFEGVVAKAGHGQTHNLVMGKAKTKRWIDAIRARHTPEDAEKLIRS